VPPRHWYLSVEIYDTTFHKTDFSVSDGFIELTFEDFGYLKDFKMSFHLHLFF
jgi:hypothetical protein